MRPSDFLISVLLHSTHLEPKLEQCPTQDSAAAVFSTCVGKTSSNHLKPSAYPSASAWIGMTVPKLNLWRFDKICFMKNIKQTPKHQGGRFMFKKKKLQVSHHHSLHPHQHQPTQTPGSRIASTKNWCPASELLASGRSEPSQKMKPVFRPSFRETRKHGTHQTVSKRKIIDLKNVLTGEGICDGSQVLFYGIDSWKHDIRYSFP